MSKRDGTIKMSTGVIFKVETVPLMVLQEINKQARRNKPSAIMARRINRVLRASRFILVIPVQTNP